MNKWIELLFGLVLINLAVVAWWTNYWGLGEATLTFFKGGLVWFVIGIGLLLILLGISDLKE